MQLLRFTYRYVQVPLYDETGAEKSESCLPVIPCQFKSGKRTTSLLYGLLDSGSDCILVSNAVSEELDLEPRKAPPVIGIGGRTSRGIAEVDIKIGSHGRFTTLENVEISVLLDEETIQVILGRDPIFKLYDITFSDSDLKVTLNPYEPRTKKKRRRRSERI
jgi:hypothetical protein